MRCPVQFFTPALFDCGADLPANVVRVSAQTSALRTGRYQLNAGRRPVILGILSLWRWDVSVVTPGRYSRLLPAALFLSWPPEAVAQPIFGSLRRPALQPN